MTVKEFRNKVSGIDEYQIWEDIDLLTVFSKGSVVTPEEVADKKIIDFEFELGYRDKIICIINVES